MGPVCFYDVIMAEESLIYLLWSLRDLSSGIVKLYRLQKLFPDSHNLKGDQHPAQT